MTELSNEIIGTGEQVNRLDDLDPDSALGVSFNSAYFDESSLNSLLREQPNYLNSLSLLFLNIRSVQKNLDSLMNYLLNLSITSNLSLMSNFVHIIQIGSYCPMLSNSSNLSTLSKCRSILSRVSRF